MRSKVVYNDLSMFLNMTSNAMSQAILESSDGACSSNYQYDRLKELRDLPQLLRRNATMVD